MQPKSGLRKKRLPTIFRWTTSTTRKRSTMHFFLGTSSSFNWTIRRTPGHRPQYLHSRSTSRKAKEDGSDFIMRRCWGSLMDTRCGNGSPISWSIRYKNYIASFVTAKVNAEDQKHPVMRGLGGSFEIEREEWYTYDKSPRPIVHVLASVDEKTYMPDSPLKMGDHPVVWSNEHVKARNVYIFMGHRPEHFKNQAFTTLFRNSILWVANP